MARPYRHLDSLPCPRDIVIYRPGPRAFCFVQKPWGRAHISVQKPRGARGVVSGQIDTFITLNMKLEKCFIFYTEWFHQQNKFAAPIKNMQGINACLKEYYISCKRIFGVLSKSTTMKAIKPTIPCFELQLQFENNFAFSTMNMPQINESPFPNLQ